MSNDPNITKNNYKFPVERRKHKRIGMNQTINSFRVNDNVVNEKVQVINISKEGVCFITTHNIEVKDLVEVFVNIPGSISIPIVIKVIWRGYRDDTFAYGGQIVAINELYRSILNEYIEKNI